MFDIYKARVLRAGIFHVGNSLTAVHFDCGGTLRAHQRCYLIHVVIIILLSADILLQALDFCCRAHSTEFSIGLVFFALQDGFKGI